MLSFRCQNCHWAQQLMTTTLFITLLTLTLILTTTLISAEPLAGTNILQSSGQFRVHGTYDCTDKCTRIVSFTAQGIYTTTPNPRIDFGTIDANFYNALTGQLLVGKQLAFQTGNSITTIFTPEEQKLLTVNGYIFDAFITYRNVSDNFTTFNVRIDLAAIDGGSSRIHTQDAVVIRSTLLPSQETRLFPIQKRNDPRVFRLSACVDLKGILDTSVTRIILTPFASWTTRLREGTSDTTHLGCFVNSLEYPTTMLPNGQLSLDIRSRHHESRDGTTFGSDLSIHCPDILFAQRYPPESEIPSTSGDLIINTYYSKSTLAPEILLWSVSINGKLHPPAVIPYLIRGNFYIEPSNNFAFARFRVDYEDDVIKQHSIPQNDEDLIQLSFESTNWDGVVQTTIVPQTPLPDDTTAVYFQKAHRKNIQNINGQEYNIQYHLLNYFNSEVPLSNFFFTIQGPIDYIPGKFPIEPLISLSSLYSPPSSSSTSDQVLIPYIAETHICHNAASSIIFYHSEENFKIDLLKLAEETKSLSFGFFRNSYRFEGQFDICEVYFLKTVNKKEKWQLLATSQGLDPDGQSFGSLESLTFELPLRESFTKDSSYRIQCQNGVTRVRHRGFIDTRELLTISFTPVNDFELADHHHMYQTTLTFSPRERTNAILIVFLVALSLAGAAAIIYFFNVIGLFRWLHQKFAPRMEHQIANVQYQGVV